MSLIHDNIIKIVIYRLSSIGDVVLATACLDLLKKVSLKSSGRDSKSISVTFVGRKPAIDLIASSFPEVKIIDLPKSLTKEQRTDITNHIEPPHLIIDLQTNLKSFLFCRTLAKKSGALIFRARKDGFRRLKLVLKARLRGRFFEMPKTPENVKKLQYQMMLTPLINGLHSVAKELDIPPSIEVFPFLPLERNSALKTIEKFKDSNALNPHNHCLSIAVGASHETKRAPVDIFINVLGTLLKKLNLSDESTRHIPSLIFLGDTNDISVSSETIQILMKELKWPSPIINLAGKCSLFETAALLKISAGLLSNDSSLGHIAEAVNTPTAILFGPTVESFGFAPRIKSSHDRNSNNARISKAFSSPIGCRPCSRHGKATCRYHDQKCFHDIDTDQIALHLINLLRSFPT